MTKGNDMQHRDKFCICPDDVDPNYQWIIVTSESVTDEINTFLSARSRWANANERNVRNGMSHWHWTLLPGDPTAEVRQFLNQKGLTEVSDFQECW